MQFLATLKYFLSNSINFYFHAQLKMLTPEEALPIILEKKVWYFWKANNQENGISFLAKWNLNMSILCPAPPPPMFIVV